MNNEHFIEQFIERFHNKFKKSTINYNIERGSLYIWGPGSKTFNDWMKNYFCTNPTGSKNNSFTYDVARLRLNVESQNRIDKFLEHYHEG